MSLGIKFTKAGQEGGRTRYRVERAATGILLAEIRFVKHDRNSKLEPHWALMHVKGRIDSFERLKDARLEAIKSYSGHA